MTQEKINDKKLGAKLTAKNNYKHTGKTNFSTADWFRDEFIDGIVLFKNDVDVYRMCNRLEATRVLEKHPEFVNKFGLIAVNMAILCHLNVGIHPDKDNTAFNLYFNKQVGFICGGSCEDMFLKRSEVLDNVIELTKQVDVKTLPKPFKRVQDYIVDGKGTTPTIRGKLRGQLRNLIFETVQDTLPTKHKYNTKELMENNIKPDGTLRAKTQGPAKTFLKEEYGLISKQARTVATLQIVYDELAVNSDEPVTQAILLDNVDESKNVVQRYWKQLIK